jgi:hypothetical protein
MAVVEVLIKIGDSPGYGADPKKGWRDGAPIEVKPPGQYFSPAEIDAYLSTVDVNSGPPFTGGTPPAGWSSLDQHDQDTIKRRLDQLAFLVAPGRTALEVTTWRNPEAPNDLGNLAQAQKMIGQAGTSVFQLSTYGLDSNWGWSDLRVHGVLLMDIDWGDWKSWSEPPIVTTSHPLARLDNVRRKRWRCKYEEFVPAGLRAQLADPATYVLVNRGMTPRDRTDFELIV